MPTAQVKQDAYNMPDILKSEAFYNAGYDSASA
jgi:hypothetical protein